MTSRRGATSLSGILLVDKPSGCTSHDVVARIRRATGERRIGHAGTLDPSATGLLVVLIGPATRLGRYLTASDKSYETTIAFGIATDTLDADGRVTDERPVPPRLFDEDFARSVLGGVVGPMLQTPPAYSAVKTAGTPAYKAARRGADPILEPRTIIVHSAALVGLDAEALTWTAEFTVSKGTYIRSLARDIGERCGTVAHVGSLRRTSSGQLDVMRAHPLELVEARAAQEQVSTLFEEPLRALPDLPVLAAPWQDVSAGKPLVNPQQGAERSQRFAVVTEAGDLAAVYRSDRDVLLPETVLALPVRRTE